MADSVSSGVWDGVAVLFSSSDPVGLGWLVAAELDRGVALGAFGAHRARIARRAFAFGAGATLGGIGAFAFDPGFALAARARRLALGRARGPLHGRGRRLARFEFTRALQGHTAARA